MLRHPTKGCPWDLEQDHKSLLRFLIEESYEYVIAAKEENYEEMEEELGDVLLQVLLHAQIASEKKHFDIYSVAKKLNEKMIRRHPHVFESPNPEISIDELHQRWEKIKAKEKKIKPSYTFNNKDLAHPPLLSSYKIGIKSNKIEFDWDSAHDVMNKVEEELNELKEEIKLDNKEKVKEEMGDLLFSIAQLARHLDLDPHDCLFDANKKFIRRFTEVEKSAAPKKIGDLSRIQKEQLWKKVKIDEKTEC